MRYPRALRYGLFVGALLILLDIGAYSIWAGNMIAVNLDSQNDDRYVTFIFWRLVIMAVGVYPPLSWALYFTCSQNAGFLFFFALIVTVGSLGFQLVAYGWYIVDIVNCSSVTHCFGSGIGPFGIDVAFFIVLVTSGTEIILSTLLIPVGIWVRYGVGTHRRKRYILGADDGMSDRSYFSQDLITVDTVPPSGGSNGRTSVFLRH